MQGAQNIVGAIRCGCLRLGAHIGAPLQFCNDQGEAQSRSERDRWTFYETIIILILIQKQNKGRLNAWE